MTFHVIPNWMEIQYSAMFQTTNQLNQLFIDNNHMEI
jgi:hypothetical protein